MSSTLRLENVLYEKKGAIAYVTVNRPKVLNALNQKTWESLRAAFEDARDNIAIRGAILTGTGDKAFIAPKDHASKEAEHALKKMEEDLSNEDLDFSTH